MITLFNNFLNEKQNSMNDKLIEYFIQNNDDKAKQCLDFGADIELYNKLYNFKKDFIKLLENIKTIYLLWTSKYNKYQLDEVDKIFNNFDEYLLFINGEGKNSLEETDRYSIKTHFFLDIDNNVLFELDYRCIRMDSKLWNNIDSLTRWLSNIEKKTFMVSYFNSILNLKYPIKEIQARNSFNTYWERTIYDLRKNGLLI